jgi:hypothetical protein
VAVRLYGSEENGRVEVRGRLAGGRAGVDRLIRWRAVGVPQIASQPVDLNNRTVTPQVTALKV